MDVQPKNAWVDGPYIGSFTFVVRITSNPSSKNAEDLYPTIRPKQLKDPKWILGCFPSSKCRNFKNPVSNIYYNLMNLN